MAVREGINLPRYPSVPGRLRAKKKEIETTVLAPPGAVAGSASAAGLAGPDKIRLRLPAETEGRVEILGSGAEAAPAVVDVLERIGVLAG